MDAQTIVKRVDQLKDSRSVIENTWDMVERYIAPYRGGFFRDEKDENAVEWRRPWIYDSTAVMSAQHLASSLHNGLTSAIDQWFTLRFRNPKHNKNIEAKRWLDECTMKVWNQIQESNFSVEINESYLDLVTYGTCILTEEETNEIKWDGIIFKSIPVKEMYFEDDSEGNVVNLYRWLQWTMVQIVDKFGVEALTEDMRDKYESESYDPDEKIDIIFCVYRRDKKWKRGKIYSKRVAMKERPYGYKFVLKDCGEQIGEEGGYHEMPAFVGRWRKTNSSMWGNSSAMIALSDTLTLNRLIELGLYAAEKAIDPPTLTTQRGLIGDLDLNAGGLTVVRDIKELVSFESKARFDVQQKEIERLQNNIKECFFINQLMLPPMGGTPATATEISVRMQQLERLMGTSITRVTKELLDPTVRRTFYFMYRQGQLPEMPESLANEGAELDIQYMGAMFKTQQASAMQNIERWAAFVGQISQINPDAMDIPDWDGIIRGAAQMLGIPASMESLDTDVEKTRGERKAKNQAMEQAMIKQQQGDAMQAVGKGTQDMGGAVNAAVQGGEAA